MNDIFTIANKNFNSRLIVCTGKYTTRIPEIQKQEKTYTGSITLGGTTPSYDLETKIDTNFETTHITKKLIKNTTTEFIGEINQKPTVFFTLKNPQINITFSKI